MEDNNPELKMALQEKDIVSINKRLDNLTKEVGDGFKKIDRHLEEYAKNYLTKEEYKKDNQILHEWKARVEREISTKVDTSDFAPIKKTLDKLNWLMISSIVMALLGLIIVKSI